MFKKRIGITQNIMKHPQYDEVLNCLDVNWSNFLYPIGILPIPLPLSPADIASEAFLSLELDGLILSGGNTLSEYADNEGLNHNTSRDRDIFEKKLVEVCLQKQIPVLGVCRGLQLINTFYGGSLSKINGHAGTRHALILEKNTVNINLPNEINSYHTLTVSRNKLGNGLVPLAYDNEDNVEAFYHSIDNVLAIMWHPEREVQYQETDIILFKQHFGL